MAGARSALPTSRAGPRATDLLAALLLFCATASVAMAATPTFPALTGRIVDQAGLLSAEDRTHLEEQLAAIEAASTDQVVVVTLKSLDGYPIEDYGYQLGRHWGIGQKDKNNGIILIVAPSERKVRIEVGYGLEPIMTDGLSRLIIENAILPEFRRGNFSGGIRNGVRDIKDVLLGDAEEVKERARSTRTADVDWVQIALFIFWVCVALYVLWGVYRSIQQGQNLRSDPRRRRNESGNYGTWGGGWSSGGDSGGGGWSGGGGSFGGGGSSGSW